MYYRFFIGLFIISASFLMQGFAEEESANESSPSLPMEEVAQEDISANEPSSSLPIEEVAQEDRSVIEPSFSKIASLLEVKAGYFFFSDSKMRKVFNAGGWDVQLCGSYPLWRWLQLYGSVEYLEKHGHSLGDHQKTWIWEIPLSLGLKPVVKIFDSVLYYFTLGPRYFFVHAHNSSDYLDKNINQNGLGGFVNTGFNFLLWKGALLIDVFGEYSFKKMYFHAHKKNVYGQTAQIGGFCFGVGLGCVF